MPKERTPRARAPRKTKARPVEAAAAPLPAAPAESDAEAVEVEAAEIPAAEVEIVRPLPVEEVEIDADSVELEAEPAEVDEEPVAELGTEAEGEPAPLDAEGADGRPSRRRPTAAEARDIARWDPLATYMREVSRYKLLTREQEHALAVRYVEGGEVEAARALVTANLRLVVKIAHEYRRAHQNLLDLVQEGNVGLMQAVKKYDPYQGVKFSSYAAWWIRAYILKYIMSNFRLVKLGTTQAQRKLFFNLRKEKEKLESAGFDATPKLLAAKLDVREDEVREMDERMGQRDLSLDAPLNASDTSDGGARHLDLLRSGGGAVDDKLAHAELNEVVSMKLREFAATLNDKERFIYENRMVAENPITLQELGDKFGISRERARQIEKRIVDRARAYLRKELGHDFDLAAEE